MYPHPRYMPPAYWYSPSPRAFAADNSLKTSAACETWVPSPNNYGFPVPGYGCCGHAYNLHYPYAGPSHQFHCCGHHPPYPGPFCTPYLPPPFYYQMEQNPNGYSGVDGLSSKSSHCCECQNHIHSQRNAEKMKAEEQEPDPDQIQDDSLVPLQMKDKPYPIVWVPTEHRKSAYHAEAPESRISSRGGMDALNTESPGEKPPSKECITTSDGWFPLDMKELASLFGDADKKRGRIHQNGGQQEQLQFPLVWLPSHQKQDKDVNEFESSNVSKASKSPEVKENSNSSQGSSEEKTKHEKTIPVVEVKSCEEDEKSKNEVGSENVNSSERGNGKSKGQSPFQCKSARLRPVCLRVDPLPKKRNGGSRSPSPPGSKGKLQETSSDSVRKTVPPKAEEGERSADNGICKPVPEHKNGERCAGDEDCAISEKIEEQPRNEGDLRNESAGEKKQPSESCTLRYAGPKAENKKLSDEEAARLIQSVYRGYEVRKWEPLKKLKQIDGVRKQVTEVRNQIHSLETSSDHPKVDKRRAIIGEMIMSLLLKLDGIQGLHPSLRDIRKSLAKELVTLQEKVDSLEVNKPEETQEDKCISSNDAQSQQEEVEVPRGQLVDKPSQLGRDMGSNLDICCDIRQPSLSVTGVVEASQEMESPARRYQEYKISDGGSRPDKDETTGMDVRAVHTNIVGGGSESCDAISAGATSLEGAGPDPKEKGPFLVKVDVNEVMHISDGSHDDGLKGLAQYDEVIAPREDTEEEKNGNLGSEGIGEMGCLLESPVGVTEEEKSGPRAMETDSLAEQEQSDVTAKTIENKEHRELREVLVPKNEPEHNVAAEQKMDTKERKLVGCTEPSIMDSEVDQDVAAEKSFNLSIGGDDEALRDVQCAEFKDLSSESEREVYCSTDQMLEGDLRHSITAPEMQKEMLIPEKKETQLDDGGNIYLTEAVPDVACPIVSAEAVDSPGRLPESLPTVVTAEVTENKEQRELWEVLVPKCEPEHNVATEQKTDTEESKLVGCAESLTMESEVDQDGATEKSVNLSVEGEDVTAKVTENKEHRELWKVLVPKSEPEHNVAAEQKTDTEERELVGCAESSAMESEADQDVAAEKSVNLSVEGKDEAVRDVQQRAVFKGVSSESERDVYCLTDKMLKGGRHSRPASEMQREILVPEEDMQLEDGENVYIIATDPDVACPIVSAEAVDSPGRLPEILPTVGLVASEEQNVALEDDRKLVEVNARLRETLEKLLEAGNEQMDAISKLTGRVRELEKKLSNRRKKPVRPRRWNAATPRCRSSTKGTAAAA